MVYLFSREFIRLNNVRSDAGRRIKSFAPAFRPLIISISLSSWEHRRIGIKLVALLDFNVSINSVATPGSPRNGSSIIICVSKKSLSATRWSSVISEISILSGSNILRRLSTNSESFKRTFTFFMIQIISLMIYPGCKLTFQF